MATFYFDGNCGFCTKCVEILQKCGFSGVILSLADAKLPESLREIDSAIYERKGIWVKSDAIILAIADCGLFWKWVLILLIVPRFIRDWVYDLVAKSRYCKL